jgi:RNA polymerase sigma-70 factor (ECF subfamily)
MAEHDPSATSGQHDPPLDHLFRREAGRMLASLTRLFGVHNLALAEDVVQDALIRALETWSIRGVPDNPAAWLMTAARRRAIDVLRHEQRNRSLSPELQAKLEVAGALEGELEQLFTEHEVRDHQLRMMFSCCDPALSEDAQVGLILNVLCGFSVREVAAAFLDSEAATEKRVQRAKHALARSGELFPVSGAPQLRERLAMVLRALYLLFNEGYHGAHPQHTMREELCEEATGLCALLAEHPATSLPETRALLALMCLHAARMPARFSGGELQSLDLQDRSLWRKPLITRGLQLLDESADGERVSRYHLEAAIAAEHACAASIEATRWDRIVGWYDLLLRVDPSPVVELNRAIAVGRAEGPARGLAAIAAIEAPERLAHYPFYEASLGELHARTGATAEAITHYGRALAQARNDAEARFLSARINSLRARSLPS